VIEAPILNWLGWAGFVGLMAFYWMLGRGRPAAAFWASTFGAAMFLIIGIASWFGYAAKLPSLVLMETCIIVLNQRSLWQLRKAAAA
jgi:hypothetical protein